MLYMLVPDGGDWEDVYLFTDLTSAKRALLLNAAEEAIRLGSFVEFMIDKWHLEEFAEDEAFKSRFMPSFNCYRVKNLINYVEDERINFEFMYDKLSDIRWKIPEKLLNCVTIV